MQGSTPSVISCSKRRSSSRRENKSQHSEQRRSSPALLKTQRSATRAGKNLAEQLPTSAVEFLKLHLLDRIEIVGAGVERDARQQKRQLQIMKARRLLHLVLAGEIVAAHLEDFDQGLCIGVTDGGLGIRDAAGEAVFV